MTNNDLVPELTNGEFEPFIKEGLVFLDFFAEWCMPCTMMSPIIDDLSEKFKQVKFGKVNVEDNSLISEKFEISSIPVFVLLKEGKIMEKISGVRSQEELEELIQKYL